MEMKRIVILNSYKLTDGDPYDLVRIKYFLKGLAEAGFTKDKNLHVKLVNSNNLGFIESALDKQKDDHIDLIHAVGTPNAAIAGIFTNKIPIVYYGAHPEGVGAAECARENICGITLTLPFTAHYKNFRFIRKLLPDAENVYVPFYESTIFCPKIMREKYRIFRSKNNGSVWVPGGSEYIPYRSLAQLCYVIGINCFELVYKDSEELSTALNHIEPKGSIIMPYNDSVYCNHAPEVLVDSSIKEGVPLLWNNNPEATQIGAMAAIAGEFKEVGLITGKMAGEILNGSKPSNIGCQISSKSYSSINLKTARIFGLRFSDDVLEHFDEVIS